MRDSTLDSACVVPDGDRATASPCKASKIQSNTEHNAGRRPARKRRRVRSLFMRLGLTMRGERLVLAQPVLAQLISEINEQAVADDTEQE